MKYIGKPYLTLFVFSVLFFLFFVGSYTIYTIYYLPYFHPDYVSYTFYSKQIPTKLELLFTGFQSGYIILHSLTIGIVLTFLAKKLNTFFYFKKGFRQILITSFIWTMLFSALYIISEFIWHKTVANFSSSFSIGVIRAQLPFLLALYFLLLLPIVALLYRRS